MTFTDYFRFHLDEEKYRKRIRRYSDHELQENIFAKRREIVSSGWGVGAGLALIPPTFGVSLVGAGVASHTLLIARDKLKVLEIEWQRRGYAPLKTHPIRDGAIPCMFAAAVSGLTLGLDAGLASAGAHAVTQAGIAGAHHLASGFIHGEGLPTGSEAAFGHGFYNGAQQVGQVFQGHINGSFGMPSPPVNPVYSVGQMMGVSAVVHAVDQTIKQGSNWAQQQAYHYMKCE